MCGLNRPTRNFDPSDYELDLKLRNNIGQGRGRDFIREDFSVRARQEKSRAFYLFYFISMFILKFNILALFS
jgi:hypothetical protein